MATGLTTTIEILTKTANEAAVGVLVPALDSPDPQIQALALRAILKRRSPLGKREVLRRIDHANQAWRELLGEFRGRMSATLRDAVLGADPQMCANGCQAILWFGEYDLMPALINAAEDPANPNAKLAAETVLELAEGLYQELAAPRDYRDRRDPHLVRQQVTTSLELSLKRYKQHKRQEIVEASLLLMGRDTPTLKKILQDPHDGGYLAVLEALKTSPRPGVMRLILSYLDDPHAPSAALTLMANRHDPKFVRHLVKKIGFEPTPIAAKNLKRINNIVWLRGDLSLLKELDDQGQHGAMQMALASGMKRLEVFAIIEYLLERGSVGGRRAAAAALAEYHGGDANRLVVQTLEDPDPQAQAHVLSQIRPRGIPGAMSRLLTAVESPHAVVRQAARDALQEFNFARFVATYDTIEEEMRRTTGALVKKVDPDTVPALQAELQLPSRTRRLRAIDICELVGAVPELQDALLKLLDDDDHMLRASAARALGSHNSGEIRHALAAALHDSSVAVRQMARESLRRIVGSAQTAGDEERQP